MIHQLQLQRLAKMSYNGHSPAIGRSVWNFLSACLIFVVLIESTELASGRSSSGVVDVLPLQSEYAIYETSQLSRASRPSASVDHLPAVCSNNQTLGYLQKKLCSLEPPIATAAIAGYDLGLKYFRNWFPEGQWNRSHGRRRVQNNHSTHDDGVQPLGMQGSKEAAFYYAITRAGIAYEIVRACAAGEIEGCTPQSYINNTVSEAIQGTSASSLDIPDERVMQSKENIRRRSQHWEWWWWSSNDNLEYSWKRSKKRLNYTFHILFFHSRNIRDKLNLHNANLGRKVLEESIRLKCKCHGVSGTCPARICWRKLPDFAHVANALYRKYRKACDISNASEDTSPHPSHRSCKYNNGNREQLLYYGKPRLCQKNERRAVSERSGRACPYRTPTECTEWCCGGFSIRKVRIEEYCNCRFIWCCRVTCDTCVQEEIVRECN